MFFNILYHKISALLMQFLTFCGMNLLFFVIIQKYLNIFRDIFTYFLTFLKVCVKM
jgi:hypothetical protein